MLKGIINEARERESRLKEPELKSADLAKNPVCNIDYAKSMLINMHTLSDSELYDLVKLSYSVLLEDIFMKNDGSYINIIANSRFLTVFMQVLTHVQLSSTERTYVCKLAYDYMVRTEVQDEYTKSLFFSISKLINRDMILKLLGLNLNEELAAYLALARYSSLKEIINVARVNQIIIGTNDPITMTDQMIIWIYEKMFDSLSDLFKGVMFNVYGTDSLDSMGENCREIYSAMTNAVLIILNNQSSPKIRETLLSYTLDWQSSGCTALYRFTIRAMSQDDFSRILAVVDNLEEAEKILVP